jgi:hypothetical protein
MDLFMLEKIYKTVDKLVFQSDIRLATLVPYILGLSFFVCANLVNYLLTHQSMSGPLTRLVFVICGVICSFSGIIQIMRKQNAASYFSRNDPVYSIINGSVHFLLCIVFIVMMLFLP